MVEDELVVTQEDREAAEAEAFGATFRAEQAANYGCAGGNECVFTFDGNCHCFNTTLARHRLAAVEAERERAINAVASAKLPKERWSCGLDESGVSLTLGRQRTWSIAAIRNQTHRDKRG